MTTILLQKINLKFYYVLELSVSFINNLSPRSTFSVCYILPNDVSFAQYAENPAS